MCIKSGVDDVSKTSFCLFFRVDEFSTKEFKRKIEKAKTCRELIQVLKVSVLISLSWRLLCYKED